jgi:hypothetical protein
MHSSREDRVVAIEVFLQELPNLTEVPPEVVAMMLGYLTSRIAPGTIQHARVLAPSFDRYPSALLWYGFCAGLPSEESPFIGNAQRARLDFPPSARRIVRELEKPGCMLGAPDADIDLLELLVLSRPSPDAIERLVRTAPGYLSVEIIPGVSTVVNLSTKSAPEPTFRKGEDEALLRLGESIELLRAAYRDLVAKGDPEAPPDAQRSLFPSKKRRR